MKRILEPTCIHKKGCFANQDGFCKILTDVNFKGKMCPFYKTKQEYEEGLKEGVRK